MSDIVPDLRFYGAKRKWPKGLHVMPYLLTTAADEITQLRTALSEAEQDVQGMRTLALEEAALWHDSQVQEYTDQIAVNDAYLARGGRLSSESRANEYCDDMRSCHRRSAAAIRALIPSEPHDAEGRE